MSFKIKINGAQHGVDVDGNTPLLWVLRDVLGMTGTKFGCGIAQCGACTVHLDGAPVRSCLLPVGAIGDRADHHHRGRRRHRRPARRSSRPGSTSRWCSAATASPGRSCPRPPCSPPTPQPDDADIDAAMAGNMCRCGTYVRIREGIKHAARS